MILRAIATRWLGDGTVHLLGGGWPICCGSKTSRGTAALIQ
jgi:hypothetical protein